MHVESCRALASVTHLAAAAEARTAALAVERHLAALAWEEAALLELPAGGSQTRGEVEDLFEATRAVVEARKRWGLAKKAVAAAASACADQHHRAVVFSPNEAGPEAEAAFGHEVAQSYAVLAMAEAEVAASGLRVEELELDRLRGIEAFGPL